VLSFYQGSFVRQPVDLYAAVEAVAAHQRVAMVKEGRMGAGLEILPAAPRAAKLLLENNKMFVISYNYLSNPCICKLIFSTREQSLISCHNCH